MKVLKLTLGLIYPVLIVLLLLTNDKICQTSVENEDNVADDSTNVVRQAEQIGRSGNLKVTLLWNFEGDIDLHVIQPNGKEIYYDRAIDNETGGSLDVDDRSGGIGAAENIYWEEPAPGEYEVYIVYFKESNTSGRAGSGRCKVVVFQEGREPQTCVSQMSKVGDSLSIVKIRI